MCISLCLKPAMVSVRMGILLAFMVTLQIILSKADPCCKTLMLQSSGSLAEGDQKHLLGLYFQDDSKDGEDGTMVYRQPGNDRGEPEVFLYYKAGDWPDMWFLNNAFGAVQGYAWIDADGQKCPELLQHQWKWYNYTLGDMQLDTEAEMVCHADPPLTTTKAPKTECCDSVTLRSDGAMADSIQKHVLGTYKVYSEDGDAGTLVYKHTERGDYLYYLKWLSLWYVGNKVGENMGFAMNEGDAKCPEELANEWKWTDGESWILDDKANMSC